MIKEGGGRPANRQAGPSSLDRFSFPAAKFTHQFIVIHIYAANNYLRYLVRPGFPIATCVGLAEILIALIQFCRDY